MSKQASVELSWLICEAGMIRLHAWSTSKDGRRRREGVGGAWPTDKESCEETWGRWDGGTAFTQAGGHERGGDGKVRG